MSVSVCLSVYLFVCVQLSACLCMYVYLCPVCLFVCLSVCLQLLYNCVSLPLSPFAVSVCLFISVHLFVCLSVCLCPSVSLSASLSVSSFVSVYLSVHVHVCLFGYLLVCLSVLPLLKHLTCDITVSFH